MIKRLPMHEKPPIWDVFFAAQFLWPQHFLHGIPDDIYRPIYVLDNKIKLKFVFSCAHGLVSKVYCLWTRGAKKPIPQKSVFSTAHFQSEKKLPYGTFFMEPNFIGLNTFYMAFQMIYMDQFMDLIIK